ncbi:MAG: hypothetical protein KatS3mg105_0385 [Gemmatales bacterium]|nr:MAG: hypothetical protein KatS3mg105_0385 [Gemmatales bacterium]
MGGKETRLEDRLKPIEMLVLDVDGVLTDGGIIYSDRGEEWKQFHVRDGSGLMIWHWLKKQSAIITGRTSHIVEVRAREMGITRVVQGVLDKLPAYEEILEECGIKPEQTCYVGDDVPDLPVLRRCGLAAAPADACADVRSVVHYVCQTRSGRGAVREVIELILRGQALWNRVLDRFSGEKV